MKILYNLLNKNTGELIQVDNIKNRFNRLRKRLHMWSNIQDGFFKSYDVKMITLTYKDMSLFQKNDIKVFLHRLKMRYKKNIVSYAWIAELQKRGVIHYHIIIIVKKGLKFEFFDQNGYWDKGFTNIKNVNSIFYLLKYTKKEYQKNFQCFPKGIRCFAVYINKNYFNLLKIWYFRLTTLPCWLSDVIQNIGDYFYFPYRVKGKSGYFYKDKQFFSPIKLVITYQ